MLNHVEFTMMENVLQTRFSVNSFICRNLTPVFEEDVKSSDSCCFEFLLVLVCCLLSFTRISHCQYSSTTSPRLLYLEVYRQSKYERFIASSEFKTQSNTEVLKVNTLPSALVAWFNCLLKFYNVALLLSSYLLSPIT